MLSERSFEAEARTPPSRLKLRLVTRLVWWEKSPTRWPCAMSHTETKRERLICRSSLSSSFGSLVKLYFTWSKIRGLPLSTYADFPAFWTPSPPCSLFGLNHKSKFTQPRLLCTLLVTLPLSAYVLYGCPPIKMKVEQGNISTCKKVSKCQNRCLKFKLLLKPFGKWSNEVL